MTYEGPDRRQHLHLSPEDKERLVKIEMYSKRNSEVGEDHEQRLRKIEPRQARQFASIAGIWTVITGMVAFLFKGLWQ